MTDAVRALGHDGRTYLTDRLLASNKYWTRSQSRLCRLSRRRDAKDCTPLPAPASRSRVLSGHLLKMPFAERSRERDWDVPLVAWWSDPGPEPHEGRWPSGAAAPPALLPQPPPMARR